MTLETGKATLTRRTSEGGSRVPIDDGGWAFADCSHKPFLEHLIPACSVSKAASTGISSTN